MLSELFALLQESPPQSVEELGQMMSQAGYPEEAPMGDDLGMGEEPELEEEAPMEPALAPEMGAPPKGETAGAKMGRLRLGAARSALNGG